MPIAYIKDIEQHTRLGVWKISKAEQLENLCPPSVRLGLRDKCETRRNETFAVYALLRELTGRYDLIIGHESSGKPFLQTLSGCRCQCQISVSHTHGYASVIISRERTVAIDIEYYSNRVMNIAKRFLRQDEIDDITRTGWLPDSNNTIIRMLIYWCAKETAYKLYSDEAMTFQNIHVDKISEIGTEGEICCHNLICRRKKTFHYIQNTDYVMTYC